MTIGSRRAAAVALAMVAATASLSVPAAEPAAATTASCTGQQLLGNPGFETGYPAPWTTTGQVVGGTAHSGSYSVVLGGTVSSTQALSLSVTIPAGCTSAVLSFWLHVVTDETTTTTAYDTLTLKIGTTTVASYSNLNHNAGWVQRSASLTGFAGRTVRITFTATNDPSLPTWFYLDDITLTVS
ncbi:MAG: hypothetical protein ACJ74O_16765 [Frankiaceae bacterium]